MPYIHEQPGWPAFTWDDCVLARPLAATRHLQGHLLGSMQALGFDLRLEANLESLTAEVVKSCAIEGEDLNPEEVRSSLARQLGLSTAGLPTPGREVEGVVEMMLDATRNFSAPLTSERLFSWHAALFPTGWSGIRRLRVGAWRTTEDGPMQVVSGVVGRERVHFQAPDAGRLEKEMARFLEWLEAPPSLDPVLVAGIAHFWFVTIHPFVNGNGRIGRAIGDLALARADGCSDRYYSLSSQIEKERKDYYAQLEQAQGGGLDITEWLEWFLGCLQRAIQSAEFSLKSVQRKAEVWKRVQKQPIRERQRVVLQRLLEGFEGNLTTSKYAKLARCSSDTALRDIQELLEWGVLARNPGSGRGTSYRLADLLEE